MLLELHTPSPPLSDYVELITCFESYTPAHTVERLFPEGVVEIIIDLTETPKFIYDNISLLPRQAFRKSWVSGVRTEPISISAGGPGSSMLIIRFRPGMAMPFLRLPVGELDGAVLQTDLLFGERIDSFREQLLESATPAAKVQMAERFLTSLFRGSPEVPPGCPCGS